MVSLLDLVPTNMSVKLDTDKNGKDITIDVRGLSVSDLATLMEAYPEFKKMFGRGVTLSPEVLLDKFPRVMAHAIALATQPSKDRLRVTPDEIDAAQNLPIGYSLTLVMAIIEQTLGKDLDGPFVQRLLALANSVDTGAGGKALDTKSPKPSKS